MRLTVFALGCIVALPMGCATEDRRTGFRGEATTYYQQVLGPSSHSFSAQKTEPPASSAPGRQSVTQTRQALLSAVNDVNRSTGSMAGALRQFTSGKRTLGDRADSVFTRYVVYGDNQLQWIHCALGGATTLAEAASEVADPDMELGILRLTGPRLQAAMSGATLLAAWVDFLSLADAVLRQ